MKIRYSNNKIKIIIKLGQFSVLIGLVIILLSVVFINSNKSILMAIGIGQIGGGLFFFVIHYYLKRKQYLTIENGVITKHTLFPKQIKLNEIKTVNKFAGDYILKTNDSEFRIDTEVIAADSLEDLNQQLDLLNI